MSIDLSRFICKCGHIEAFHNKKGTFFFYACTASSSCNCAEYKQDNLKYLEKQYEQKNVQ